jgi:hypothetical protein
MPPSPTLNTINTKTPLFPLGLSERLRMKSEERRVNSNDKERKE